MTLYIRWFALATLVAGSLSASVPDQAGTGATDRNLMFSSLPPDPIPTPWKCPLPEYDFKKCSCPPCNRDKTPSYTAADLPFPRERKEWREHTKDEIDRYACALNVMDTHTTKELRECFGETAWSFPDLVNLHACAAADPRGDQGHRTPGFMLFHKSYVLTFEAAMLAIDPKIGATPWWNMALDSAPVLNLDGTVKKSAGEFYCPTPSNGLFGSNNDHPKNANPGCDPEKYIWSDTYFGEQIGSGPNFEVTNGRWAYRKMPRWSDFDHEYWMQDPKHGVTNQCITDKYLNPRSANKDTPLRKSPSFYNQNNLFNDDFHQATQNCERCCDAHQHANNDDCTCEFGDRAETYMRGPTLDTRTCSPYVTRNPNGRGTGTHIGFDPTPPTLDSWPANGNGRSQQDSLIRYTKQDFDTCAHSDNTRTWIEWQNCQEENLSGTLEGEYCPAEKDTCTQKDLKKVYALHSTAHDKTLGEIGDVTTSPSDPALFFSYHAYIDKNFMEWQTSMMEKQRFVDSVPPQRVLGHHDKSDQQPDLTNKNYFGYPRQVTLSEWEYNVAKFAEIPFVKDLISNSSERMDLRSYVVPVDKNFHHFDLQQWIDLLGLEPSGDSNGAHQFPNKTFSEKWRNAATLTDEAAIAIYNAHAGHERSDADGFHMFFNTLTADKVYPDFLGPACSSLTNNLNGVAPSDGSKAKGQNVTEAYFNPTFSSNCIQPSFPSPQEGSLTYNLTQGARTYSSSGPFIYMTSYRPADFFVRGSRADPTLPWVPGTLLQDVALGGLPFRNMFPTDDGGEFGYTNKDIIELSLPCFPGRSPGNTSAPCAPYSYSNYNGEDE
mmetsp:Transcript_15429/g.50211  ORF Transcript_15429/g.50211 Transcript_15429/m.50211 type:complete len:829 (-) Transcript_15429:41-2527(-)